MLIVKFRFLSRYLYEICYSIKTIKILGKKIVLTTQEVMQDKQESNHQCQQKFSTE